MFKIHCRVCGNRTISEAAYLTSSRLNPSVCSVCKANNYMKMGRKFIFMLAVSVIFWVYMFFFRRLDMPYLTIVILPLLVFFSFKVVFYNAKMSTVIRAKTGTSDMSPK